jgi:hypothetical protein
MLTWLIALLAGALAAAVQYGRKAFAPQNLPLAILRGIGVTLVVALVLSARAGRATSEAADVALDASESWTRASDESAWKSALDSASHAGGQVRRCV